ncbi:MAG TPA: hypothetical protein VMF30_01360 [Pirellulales bacterium]|nr:hypothetical protein [Pirellulales bacterium]
MSILYAIPLTVLACYGQLRALRWVTLLAITLTCITYFIKYQVYPPDGAQFLNFRIINRAAVAIMLWLLSKVLGLWFETEAHRQEPLWSDDFERAHHQISSTLGMLIAMPTVVLIAMVDGLTPANFNVAVLYTVPLVTCAWVRSERLLWTMFLLLQVLAFGGLYWGPPSTQPLPAYGPLQNRCLFGVMMFIIACLLHYWIRSSRQQMPLAQPTRIGSPDSDDQHVSVG